MSRRCSLIAAVCLLLSGSLVADDQALWREYGLVRTETSQKGTLRITAYQMKDLTGALAAWEWLRPTHGRSCDLASFCSGDTLQTAVSDDNYVVIFDGAVPKKTQVDAVLSALPNKHETSLPAILTFLPQQGLVPNSAKYILGAASLQAFAPELAVANPGFEQGPEAQVAEYKLHNGAPVHLAIFYYPTPEMARLHSVAFRLIPNAHVKRSGVLLAVVFGPSTDQQAETLLSRVQYEAKITWNETPPPSPIKPLFQLLMNIMYLTVVLSAVCLLAGLMYAGMRIYRRRYGTLEADESMTTLHLTGD